MKSLTTNELIEVLKREDPSGKLYVRGVGSIVDVERLPGYWDGYYEYLDEDGYFHITRKGEKVNLVMYEWEDFIADEDGDTSKLIIEDTDHMKKEVEEFVKDWKRMRKQSFEHHFSEVMKKYKDGFVAVQHKDSNINHINEQWWWKRDELNELKNLSRKDVSEKNDYKSGTVLCQGDSGVVLKSGFFKSRKINNHIIWDLEI